MRNTKQNNSFYDFIVCKHDLSPMTYCESNIDNVGILKCNVCKEKYLVIDNIILTDYNLMSKQDREIQKKISKIKKVQE